MPDATVGDAGRKYAHQPPFKPDAELFGNDGNGSAIIGRCSAVLARTMRDSGFDGADIKDATAEFVAAAKAGDYEHLLAVVDDWFEVS